MFFAAGPEVKPQSPLGTQPEHKLTSHPEAVTSVKRPTQQRLTLKLNPSPRWGQPEHWAHLLPWTSIKCIDPSAPIIKESKKECLYPKLPQNIQSKGTEMIARQLKLCFDYCQIIRFHDNILIERLMCSWCLQIILRSPQLSTLSFCHQVVLLLEYSS